MPELIFESTKLDCISPGIMSMANLIYLDELFAPSENIFSHLIKQIFPNPLIDYIQNLDGYYFQILSPLLTKTFSNFIISNFKMIILQFISIFDILLDELLKLFIIQGKISPEKSIENTDSISPVY